MLIKHMTMDAIISYLIDEFAKDPTQSYLITGTSGSGKSHLGLSPKLKPLHDFVFSRDLDQYGSVVGPESKWIINGDVLGEDFLNADATGLLLFGFSDNVIEIINQFKCKVIYLIPEGELYTKIMSAKAHDMIIQNIKILDSHKIRMADYDTDRLKKTEIRTDQEWINSVWSVLENTDQEVLLNKEDLVTYLHTMQFFWELDAGVKMTAPSFIRGWLLKSFMSKEKADAELMRRANRFAGQLQNNEALQIVKVISDWDGEHLKGFAGYEV